VEESARDKSRTTQVSRIAAEVKTYKYESIPPILFASVSVHFDLLHPSSAREWINVRGPKIVMHIFDCKPGRLANREDKTAYMAARLAHALAGVHCWMRDPSVFGLTPRLSDQASSLSLHARAFLLAGGRPRTLDRLLSYKVISFLSLTVAFFPFAMCIPELATRLTGFADHTTTDDVWRIVKESWTQEPMRTIIAGTITMLLGVDVTGAGATTVEEWADHIRVKEVCGEREKVFAILTEAPAPSAEEYYTFRRAIQEAAYVDRSLRRCGMGRVIDFAYCSVCGGNDHHAKGCAFPSMIPPSTDIGMGKAGR
jgi:hypothetical protein